MLVIYKIATFKLWKLLRAYTTTLYEKLYKGTQIIPGSMVKRIRLDNPQPSSKFVIIKIRKRFRDLICGLKDLINLYDNLR